MPEISDTAIVRTDGSDKAYQPPSGLPFKTTDSYESDKEAYLKKRDTLYHKNCVAMRRTTGKILRALKAGTPSNEEAKNEDCIYSEHRNLTALDRFFDIRDEC